MTILHLFFGSRYIAFVLYLSIIVLLEGCELGSAIPEKHVSTDEAVAVIAPEDSSVKVGSEINVTGRLVSTACYVEANALDEDQRKACSVDKTKQGFPVAVLEQDHQAQKAWILLTVPQIFTDYMDRTVRVRGVVRGDGVLTPLRVELKAQAGWTYIM